MKDEKLRSSIEYQIRLVVDELSQMLEFSLGDAVRKKNETIRKGADAIYKLVKD